MHLTHFTRDFEKSFDRCYIRCGKLSRKMFEVKGWIWDYRIESVEMKLKLNAKLVENV